VLAAADKCEVANSRVTEQMSTIRAFGSRKAMMQRLERPQVDSIADVETNFLQAPVCIMVVPSARAAFLVATSTRWRLSRARARVAAAALLETHSTKARPPLRCPDTRK